MYDWTSPAKIKTSGRSTATRRHTEGLCLRASRITHGIAEAAFALSSLLSSLPSLPLSLPLPRRMHVVLTAQGSRRAEGALQSNQGQAHDSVCAVFG